MLSKLMTGDSPVSQFFQVVPFTLLVTVLCLVIRLCSLKKRGHPFSFRRELPLLLLAAYLTGLLSLVLVPRNFWLYFWHRLFYGVPGGELDLSGGGWNLVPMLWYFIKGEMEIGGWVGEMLLGNFLMFLPLGLLWRFSFPEKRGREFLLTAVLLPLGIELLQPLIGRSFDIDDLILNTLGTLCGYGIYLLLRRCAPRFTESLLRGKVPSPDGMTTLS